MKAAIDEKPTRWKLLQEEYENNTISLENAESLRKIYSPLLDRELLEKQSKDTYALAGIFRDIASSNIKLAKAGETNPSLRLQYYNDGAIACYHGLSVIEKGKDSNKTIELQENIKLKLQELESEIYYLLNNIQISIVSVSGGSTDKLHEINGKADADNIAKRDIIEQLRSTTKDQLQAIEVAKEDKDDVSYIKRTASLFKQIAGEMENYLAQLYKDAQDLLGIPPCDYTVIGLGSMALRQMTPYSDLEFAILTANEDYKQSDDFKIREYFKNLTQIVHFKVINLGETIMPISSYGFDFKEFIKTAVNFDLGGKTPLGRVNKPYELIQTVEGMLNYLRNEEDKTMHIDKTLQNIVQKTCLIYQCGESNLAVEYQNRTQEFLLSPDETNGRSYCENRAVKILSKGGIEMDYTKEVPEQSIIKGNLEQFAFDSKSEGKLFDVKQEIYRMPDRFIYYLGLIYGVQEESSWDTINKLYKEGFINEQGAFNLKKALSFATNLRLKAYSHYGCQKEAMDYAKAYEVSNNQSKEELVERELITTFRLTNDDLKEDGTLFEFYYTALALTQKLTEFCDLPETQQQERFFADTEFYQDNAYTKAQINLRLTRYEDALKYQLEDLEVKQKTLGNNHLYIAQSLNNISSIYIELGDYNKALEHMEKALKIRQKTLDNDHPDVATSLNNIGLIYIYLSNYSKALEYIEKALKIRQKTLAQDHPHVANSFNNIGSIYGHLGQHNKALEYQEKALKIRQKVLSEEHQDIAQSFNNIGLTYGKLGQHNKALGYQEKALEIWQKTLGNDHPHVATSLNNIGSTYGKLGQHNKALEYQEKVLEIFQKFLGKDHPHVATSLNNISSTYGSLGQYNKALECQEKALEIFQKFLGKDHPHVATSLNNISSTYGSLGQYNQALEYQEKVLKIRQKTLGNDHPDVADSLNNIGLTYGSLGQYNQALKYIERALKIKQKTLAQDHPDVAISLNNIGSTYGHLGQHNKALEYQEKALEIFQKFLGKDHPHVADSLNNIGLTYGYLGNHNKALEYQEKALKIWQKTLGNDHPDIAQSLNNIGTTYEKLGQHNKALEYIEKALEIFQKFLGKDHPHVADSLNNIGYTYGDLGQHNKALEYREKALEIWQKSLGENHPDITRSLYDIGCIYLHLSRYDEAISKITSAIDIYKKTNQTKKIQENTENIKNIKMAKRDYEKAVASLSQQEKLISSEISKSKLKPIFRNAIKPMEEALKLFKQCSNFANGEKIEKNILKTLSLLIKAHDFLNQPKKSAPYKKEYDALKKTIEEKQLKLQEIEEYLLTQKQAWEEKEKQDLADKILTIIEEKNSLDDMLQKADNAVRVVSYNIVADFFDNRDKTLDHHHHWQYRAPFVKILLKGVYPEVICLQELSAEQALELDKYFGGKLGYKSVFLSQTPSDIETGAIAYGEEVAEWQGKFLGASLIGTFISKSFEFVEIGRFWLNENPDVIPDIRDRGETDKGFGNMNTYRAVLWSKLQIEDKLLFVFNSHYPLSGNNETRFKCAELEMNKIKEIAGDNPWVSVGDKNIIPCKDDDDLYNPEAVYRELVKNGRNIVQSGTEHKGIATTWIGFTYDEHKNNIDVNGKFEDSIMLDVIVSNLASVNSFHHHGAFDSAESRLLSLTEILTQEQNEQRYFASDHALIGADFVLE